MKKIAAIALLAFLPFVGGGPRGAKGVGAKGVRPLFVDYIPV